MRCVISRAGGTVLSCFVEGEEGFNGIVVVEADEEAESIWVVGGGGRALKEAVRRWWSLVVSERICLGMRQGKGTIEEKAITTSYTFRN